ncbi:hypothetical protein M9Y10_039290 [Tritrichomonas musculus]|uniref:Myb-like DNA-binding domain containing protein n=1 Tax=Tritrichomonas musculus TaxID=1915356 RepID=A0ABR2KBF0_9EUKA
MKKLDDRTRQARLAGPLSRKVKFTKTEDLKLRELVERYSTDDWKIIARHLPPRTARQCRERWCNYIDPNLTTEPWTPDEDEALLRIHEQIGNHWKKLEEFFPKRSKNSIKKRWHMLKGTNEEDEEIIDFKPSSNSQPMMSSINAKNTLTSSTPNTLISSSSIPHAFMPMTILPPEPTTVIPVAPLYISVNLPMYNVSNRITTFIEDPHIYMGMYEKPHANFSNSFVQNNLCTVSDAYY